MREDKVRVYHHPPSRLYLLVTDRVPEIRFLGTQNELKNGFLKQVEQGGFFTFLPNVWHI